MNSSKTKLAAIPQTLGLPTLHRLEAHSKTAAQVSKSLKRVRESAKSRDTREDRGTREIKTTHSSQTFPHAR